MRNSILIALLLSLAVSPATSQTRRAAYLSSPPLEKREAFPPGSGDGQNDPNIYLAHSLADKILALRDVKARSLGTARIADVLWPQDEAYARMLFGKALGLLSDTESPTADPRLLFNLRRRVTSIIARRDFDWARVLIDSATQSGDAKQDSQMRNAMNINAAENLLERDPARAVKFAERSLQGNINPGFVAFLLNARKTNSAAANGLFLQSLAHLAQYPGSNVRELHTLGVYLFTAPSLLDSDLMAITRVGELMLPNISTQRPNVPTPLVREYLRTAGVVLWRAASDPSQKPYAYALGYLLVPKARTVAPDLANQIESAMAAMALGVAPNLGDETTYKYINAVPATSAERVANAENLPDQESREIAYLDLANWAWRKGDFKTARVANSRISDVDLAAKVAMLIDFGEGISVLKRDPKRIGEAASTAVRLPHGLEEAVLDLVIARTRAKLGQNAQAEEAAHATVKAAMSVIDVRRGFLLLLAAAQFAELKSPATQLTLVQAIKELNTYDESDYAAIEWSDKIELGQLTATFPLELANLDFSFSKAFHRAIAADPDSGVASAEELKSEDLRAQAFVEVASSLLERIPAKSSPEDPLVIVGEDGIRKSAVKTVMPTYPGEALKKREQGTVVVELQYDSKGDVTDVSILESPTASISTAVSQAAKQWKFAGSKTMDGKSVNIRGKLTFYFEIDKTGKGLVNNPKQYR
jgi:TonB family protein